MALEFVAQIPASALYSSSTGGYDRGINLVNTPGNRLKAVSLPKLSSASSGEEAAYHTTFVIPGSLTMATGLTFGFLLTDDGADAADLGTVVRLGVTVKRLISGESSDNTASAGTEQTVDVTLQSTSGNLTAATLAIANANLDSAVVGNIVAVRIRRIGSHANDTCKGRALLVHAHVQNT